MAGGLPLLVLALLGTVVSITSSLKNCPPCGGVEVPHPLSTGDACGEPNYKLSCENDVLSFPAMGGASYMVININNHSNTIVLGTPPLEPSRCRTTDLDQGGLRIEESSPFSMTNRNTVMLLRCRKAMLQSPFNCSSSSVCRKFLRVEGGIGCKHKLCCSYLTGSGSHSIKVGDDEEAGCTAYTSVWGGFDPSASPNMWGYGVELQWQPPPRHHGHSGSVVE